MVAIRGVVLLLMGIRFYPVMILLIQCPFRSGLFSQSRLLALDIFWFDFSLVFPLAPGRSSASFSLSVQGVCYTYAIHLIFGMSKPGYITLSHTWSICYFSPILPPCSCKFKLPLAAWYRSKKMFAQNARYKFARRVLSISPADL